MTSYVRFDRPPSISLAGERAAHESGPLGVEQGAEPVGIETWRLLWVHHRSYTRFTVTRLMMPTGRYVVQWAARK